MFLLFEIEFLIVTGQRKSGQFALVPELVVGLAEDPRAGAFIHHTQFLLGTPHNLTGRQLG